MEFVIEAEIDSHRLQLCLRIIQEELLDHMHFFFHLVLIEGFSILELKTPVQRPGADAKQRRKLPRGKELLWILGQQGNGPQQYFIMKMRFLSAAFLQLQKQQFKQRIQLPVPPGRRLMPDGDKLLKEELLGAEDSVAGRRSESEGEEARLRRVFPCRIERYPYVRRRYGSIWSASRGGSP